MLLHTINKSLSRRLCSFGLALSLFTCVQPIAVAQSADEAAVRSLAAKYFELYQKKELDGLMRLWGDTSPDFAANRQILQKTFADHNRLEVKNVSIRSVTIAGDKASARVALEIIALEAKTGKPAPGFGKWNRTLHFSKEDKDWRVIGIVSSEEELAAIITAVQTDEERKSLVEKNQELQNAEFVNSLTRQGRQQFDQRNMVQAYALYNLSLKVAEKIGDRAGKANTLRLIGLYHSREGRKEQALQYYKESLNLAKEAGSREMEARALNSIGIFHQQRAEYEEALKYFQQVKIIAEDLQDDSLLFSVLNNTAIVLTGQSKYTLARDALTQSLDIVKKLGDNQQIAILLNNLGIVNRRLDKYDEALEYFHQALNLAETRNDQGGIAGARMGIGDIYQLQGNFTKALEEFEKSRIIVGELNDKAGLAKVTMLLGVIQVAQGNYTQALTYYKDALKLYEELKEKDSIAIVWGNIGGMYVWLGDFAQALEYYRKSLAISEEIGDQEGVAITLGEIAKLHYRQGNFTQVLKLSERSLIAAEKCNCTYRILSALINIATYYISQKQYAQSWRYLERSLQLARETGNKYGLALALDNIGSANHKQGKTAEALENFREGLKLAEELNIKERTIRFLYRIAGVYTEQEKFAESLELTDRAALLAKSSNSLENLWQIFFISGESHRGLKQNERANQDFIESITAIEKAREGLVGNEQEIQNYFKNKNEPYHAMIDLLVSQNKTSEALAYAERFKGRVLLETLQSGKVNVSKIMSAKEQEQERKLKGELISLNTQIARENLRDQPAEAKLKSLQVLLQKARQEYEEFQLTLYVAHPELKIQRGELQPLTLNDANRLLPDANSALLEFVVKDDKSFLFVITRKEKLSKNISQQTASKTSTLQQANLDLKVYALNIKQEDLAALTGTFAKAIANRSAGYKESAAKLYNLLLKPAQAQLQNINNLIIVPDDVLWELPFQALQSSPTRFLLQDYAVSYAPSLSILREMNKKRGSRTNQAPATLLAFGNPDIGKEAKGRVEAIYMDEKLEPLPEAERQVKALAQLYASTPSKTYIGAEAREERMKEEASRYRILHLATHGILNNTSPMYSHLLLSQSPGNVNEDGLLEAWEIMKMDLNADLVVLSACDTARGEISTGEGVIGLSWALFVAGCPAAVVSQWKVESASTTELMLEFHERLKANPTPPRRHAGKAEALRQAALKLLASKEYQHPFYWAAFIVVGDNSWK
jgi:CHAT domain-containing protein